MHRRHSRPADCGAAVQLDRGREVDRRRSAWVHRRDAADARLLRTARHQADDRDLSDDGREPRARAHAQRQGAIPGSSRCVTSAACGVAVTSALRSPGVRSARGLCASRWLRPETTWSRRAPSREGLSDAAIERVGVDMLAPEGVVGSSALGVVSEHGGHGTGRGHRRGWRQPARGAPSFGRHRDRRSPTALLPTPSAPSCALRRRDGKHEVYYATIRPTSARPKRSRRAPPRPSHAARTAPAPAARCARRRRPCLWPAAINGLLAATARVNGFVREPRNTRDVRRAGIEVINAFEPRT